jgi:hypothetical protein
MFAFEIDFFVLEMKCHKASASFMRLAVGSNLAFFLVDGV